LAQTGLDPHFIRGDQSGPLKSLKAMHSHEDQPSYGPNLSMIWSIYESVHAQGVRVLLDGHDGDTTVSYGGRYLHDLARAGHWFKLTAELRGLAKNHGVSTLESLKAFTWHYRIKPLFNRHKSLRVVQRIWQRSRDRVSIDNRESPRSQGWQHLLNAKFAAEIDMPERYRAWRKTVAATAKTEREAHYRTIIHPMQAFALEVHDGIAAAFSVEKRYPFWDKRLVEFCLGLPSQQKLNKGWTRIVMRRAMEGILPGQIQWRNDKADFTPSLAYGLKVFESSLLNEVIIRNPAVIENYVSVTALRQAYDRFLNQGSKVHPEDVFNIWKAVSLALWFQQAGFR
jgi:asparagine synthase (glutamine-hydrolysing)